MSHSQRKRIKSSSVPVSAMLNAEGIFQGKVLSASIPQPPKHQSMAKQKKDCFQRPKDLENLPPLNPFLANTLKALSSKTKETQQEDKAGFRNKWVQEIQGIREEQHTWRQCCYPVGRSALEQRQGLWEGQPWEERTICRGKTGLEMLHKGAWCCGEGQQKPKENIQSAGDHHGSHMQ